jgi:hypothetical protein
VIYVHTPFCPSEYGKNLGLAYNLAMETVPDGHWAILKDHDAMPTTYFWYHQFERAAREEPNAGFFTVHTNRVWCPWQTEGLPEDLRDSHDLRAHRRYGEERAKRYGAASLKIDPTAPLFSGVCFLLHKDVWRETPFAEGMMGVDNRWDLEIRKRGLGVFFLPGVYFYHWYRADGARHLDGSHNALCCQFDGKGECPRCGQILGERPSV